MPDTTNTNTQHTDDPWASDFECTEEYRSFIRTEGAAPYATTIDILVQNAQAQDQGDGDPWDITPRYPDLTIECTRAAISAGDISVADAALLLFNLDTSLGREVSFHDVFIALYDTNPPAPWRVEPLYPSPSSPRRDIRPTQDANVSINEHNESEDIVPATETTNRGETAAPDMRSESELPVTFTVHGLHPRETSFRSVGADETHTLNDFLAVLDQASRDASRWAAEAVDVSASHVQAEGYLSCSDYVACRGSGGTDFYFLTEMLRRGHIVPAYIITASTPQGYDDESEAVIGGRLGVAAVWEERSPIAPVTYRRYLSIATKGDVRNHVGRALLFRANAVGPNSLRNNTLSLPINHSTIRWAPDLGFTVSDQTLGRLIYDPYSEEAELNFAAAQRQE